MSTLASTYLSTALAALVNGRNRLESSGDLPELTMAERKTMLTTLTLLASDVADIRKLLA